MPTFVEPDKYAPKPTTNGTGEANKALVVDGSKNISGIGTVGCGAITSSGNLSVTGEIHATNDITAYYSSDKRLKDKIQPIQEPLTKLDTIGGYTFEWIPKEGVHSHEGPDVGVIAQEIEGVLPEIVTTRDNGYKAVRYEKIVPLLIESIKAQQLQINSLRERINLLEKNNE
jgi:hypothetical protein